ncbi:MAG: hypothetical protein IJQ39_12020 [Thermoguttaceae bacterium]|nr:hypothetical protein [Thermoguttaceae bacterium]
MTVALIIVNFSAADRRLTFTSNTDNSEPRVLPVNCQFPNRLYSACALISLTVRTPMFGKNSQLECLKRLMTLDFPFPNFFPHSMYGILPIQRYTRAFNLYFRPD